MAELENPYAKWIRGTGLVTAFCAALILLLLAAKAAGMKQEHPAFIVSYITAATLIVFCLILLPVFYFTGRTQLKDIRELVESNHWAHWQYSPDEWHSFTEKEWARRQRKAKLMPLQALAACLLGGLLLAWKKADVTATEGLLIGGVIGVPIGLLVGVIAYLMGKATYQKRLEGPGDVYIGPKGVYQHGSYSTWGGYGLTLDNVKFEAGDPSVVHFEIKGLRGATEEVRVAVPCGHEKEAEELVERFSAPR